MGIKPSAETNRSMLYFFIARGIENSKYQTYKSGWRAGGKSTMGFTFSEKINAEE